MFLLCARVTTLVVSFLGAAANSAIAAHIISFCRSLRWDVVESEWDESEISWNFGIDTIKFVWAILSVYFTVSAVACIVGFIGALKRRPSFVKLYRDYSVADLSISALSTLLFGLASFRPAVRTSVCEELARHPELMRDLAEAGLDIENCEPWFERAAVAFVGVMAVVLVVRLQFALAVSNFSAQLSRTKSYHTLEDGEDFDGDGHRRRIFLLPTRSAVPSASSDTDVVVYAPVPLSSLSPQETHDLDAAEAWLSRTDYQKRHHAHHRRSNSSKSRSPTRTSHHRRRSSTTRIHLPVVPGEPLLPEYASPKRED